MEQLPPLPKGIRILKPIEAETLGHGVWRSPKECQTCKGAKTFRYYSLVNPNEVVDFECPCVDQWIMHRYFTYHGIGMRYQRLGWRDGKGVSQTAMFSVLSYLDNIEQHLAEGTGLYLYGPNGTGKTLMGNLVLKTMMARGYNGYATTFIDLTANKSAGWKNEEQAELFQQRVRDSHFLLIDDIGKEQMNGERQAGFLTSLLDEIVRYRNAMQLPTIITANYSDEVFKQRYGGSVASLLSESVVPVRCDGQDYRPIDNEQALYGEADGITRPVVVA